MNLPILAPEAYALKTGIYTETEWKEITEFLLLYYPVEDVKNILESKHMRWADDSKLKDDIDSVTNFKDYFHYYLTPADVAELRE